jgi:norsolorinic acid ketoreductase
MDRWIQTDMGLHSAKCFGLDDATTQHLLLKEGDSHPGMMKVFDEATRETHSGKFWNYEGQEEAW